MLLDNYLMLNVYESDWEIDSSWEPNEIDLESDGGQEDVSETVVFNGLRVQIIELHESDSDDNIDFFT